MPSPISGLVQLLTRAMLCLGLHADEKSTWVFQRSGDLWLNSNLIMQPWVFGRAGEEPGMKGWDVIIVNDDGRVKELYAVIEGVSTH